MLICICVDLQYNSYNNLVEHNLIYFILLQNNHEVKQNEILILNIFNIMKNYK